MQAQDLCVGWTGLCRRSQSVRKLSVFMTWSWAEAGLLHTGKPGGSFCCTQLASGHRVSRLSGAVFRTFLHIQARREGLAISFRASPGVEGIWVCHFSMSLWHSHALPTPRIHTLTYSYTHLKMLKAFFIPYRRD